MGVEHVGTVARGVVHRLLGIHCRGFATASLTKGQVQVKGDACRGLGVDSASIGEVELPGLGRVATSGTVVSIVHCMIRTTASATVAAAFEIGPAIILPDKAGTGHT